VDALKKRCRSSHDTQHISEENVLNHNHNQSNPQKTAHDTPRAMSNEKLHPSTATEENVLLAETINDTPGERSARVHCRLPGRYRGELKRPAEYSRVNTIDTDREITHHTSFLFRRVLCMYVCTDSAAPAHARTRAHRPAASRQSSGVSQTPYPTACPQDV